MDTRQVTSSDREKIMDTHLGQVQLLCMAALPRGQIESPCGFAFKTCLVGQKFRAVCAIVGATSRSSMATKSYCAVSRFCL